MKQTVIIFPGLGYHTDKPLLYYSKKLAAVKGIPIIELKYPLSVKEKETFYEGAEEAFDSCKSVFEKLDFSSENQYILVAKSIGTVVAMMFKEKYEPQAKAVLYTPIPEAFKFDCQNSIVFHGTSDPMMNSNDLKELCDKNKIEHCFYQGANHSIETGNVITDIENLKNIMDKVQEYLSIE